MRRNHIAAAAASALLALLVAVFAAACGGKDAAEKETDAAVQADETPDQTGAPKIVVDKETLDFGEVKQGAEVKQTFTIRNKGDADLKIERARGS